MQLKIRNKIIVTPIYDILCQLRSELNNGKLKTITDDKKRNVVCNCISHKDGYETNPSMSVFSDLNDEEVEYGKCHCFTCGYTASLPQMVADVFNQPLEFGEDWLLDRFGDIFVLEQEYLHPIDLQKKIKEPDILAEESLTQFDYYHPYMWQRKLSKEVVDEFRVGYDKVREAITFPVYDEKHRLVMVTARSVNTKHFYIPDEVEKPVYLLYDLIQRGITTAFVFESQINTLYFRSLFPEYYSIGLFGTGSKTQLETLKKSGIRNYILCFDGDEGGRKGATRFKRTMGNDVFISDIQMPWGKDANDFSKAELIEIFNRNGVQL